MGAPLSPRTQPAEQDPQYTPLVTPAAISELVARPSSAPWFLAVVSSRLSTLLMSPRKLSNIEPSSSCPEASAALQKQQRAITYSDFDKVAESQTGKLGDTVYTSTLYLHSKIV